jgi:hypothetical protein
LLALRWIPAVAGGASVLARCRTRARARRLLRWPNVLAALAIACAPVNVGTTGLYSMNSFEPLFWSGIALCLARLARGASERVWLALGALAGFGLLNKHSTAFFVVACIVRSARDAVARANGEPLVLRGLLVALGDRRSARRVADRARLARRWVFLRNAQEHKNAPVSPLEFVLGQVLDGHPIGFALLVIGLAALLVAPVLRPFRALGVAAACTLALLCALKAEVLLRRAALPAALRRRRRVDRRLGFELAAQARRRCVRERACSSRRSRCIPSRSQCSRRRPTSCTRGALGLKPPQNERSRLGALPQHFADQFGWRELAETVARVHASLPATERDRVVVYAQNYGEAAAIEYFAREFDLPPVCCGHNSYFGWGLPHKPLEVVLVVGGEREDHLGEFEEVEPAAVHDSPWAMPYERELIIFVCRKPRRPIEESFAATRFYI